MHARKVAKQIMPDFEDFADVVKEQDMKEMFEDELDWLDLIFKSDAKNYHAWSHKIWLIERFEIHSMQTHMVFVETLLDDNVRNNSVWSFRYFI